MSAVKKTFLSDEDGAVTVDWVVLTAAVVGIGVVAVFTLMTANQGLGNSISSAMSSATLTKLDFTTR
ncbi:hypothetical protein [Roseovarius pacificus]|uniref:hypothetical protein n=1 Tax=Roseovarius pacificus TaxID=337701 RepID=UPI00259ADEEC|nr:hypothetical protein [Roseovarius pacificus]MDW3118683.1 hypothetical protein [Roseovarius pacificus]